MRERGEVEDPDYLIIERSGAGHRSWYVRLLVDELALSGSLHRCRLVVSEGVTDRVEWRTHMGDAPAVETIRLRSITARSLAALLTPRTLVVVPDGDRSLPMLARLAMARGRRLHARILLLRPMPVNSWRSRVASIVKRVLIRLMRLRGTRFSSVALAAADGAIDEPYVLDPVCFEPHPVDRDGWLHDHGIAPRQRVALVIGEVSERKCVPELVAAVDDCPRTDIMLALVGRPSQGVAELLRRRPDEAETQQVISIPDFVSDRDFDTWVSAVDVVCILHKNEGSSGVLLKAWAAGTPVLVGASVSVVEAAAELSLTRVEATTLSAAGLGRALADAVDQAPGSGAHDWERRTRDFARAVLGLPPTQDPII